MKRSRHQFFWEYFKKYKSFYAIGISSLVIVDVLEIFPPLLLKKIIDALESKSFTTRLLIEICVLYVAVAVLQACMRFLWRRYIVRTSMYAADDLRSSLFYKLTTLPISYFKKSRTGELVSLSTNDIESVRFSLGPGALTLFDALFYFLTIPPVMFYLSPKLTLICFGPLVILPFLVFKLEKKIRKSFTEVQERFSDLAASCQEALSGIRIIKSNALEESKEKSFNLLGQNYIDANIRSAWNQSTLNSTLDFFVTISTGLVILFGGLMVLSGGLSIGVFVAFQRYVQKLVWPMEAIGLSAGIFQRSLASQDRLHEVFSQNAAEKNPDGKSLDLSEAPEVKIQNLSFFYPKKERPALKNISLIIKPRMKLGLVGGVGSGKSTLLQCLARMENIPNEMIFWNGVDVNEFTLPQIRSQIALVPQDVLLFSETIENNVLYGSELFQATKSRFKTDFLRNTLKASCILEEVEKLPAKHETILGERGVNMSGGQRQRVSIARALARRPRLLLLDDCMSALDSETESRLIASLYNELKETSVVVSSHRLSIMKHMDWILELRDGEIISQGPPDKIDLVEESIKHV